jgi:N-hydroxyarylamine O-acetyltransferase
MSNTPLMDAYLQRLGVDADRPPSWPVLCDLVVRHTYGVPFENLDIINELRPELSTAGVLHKLAMRRRGGFCYELNEAFRALLTHLGFEVSWWMARRAPRV